MYVVARVERRAEADAVLSEHYVSSCGWVSVHLRDTKVKHVQRVGPFPDTHCKITGLDIP